MMEMIPFYLIFPNVVGFWGGGGGGKPPPRPPFPYIYFLKPEIVYIYFIYSATRHHSNISLASTNKIWGILKADI